MMLLSAHSLTCTLRGRPLFENITLAVRQGERVALIGRNGSGKSTLLSMLAKVHDPDGGEVVVGKETRVAFVEQHDTFDTETRSLLTIVEEAAGEHSSLDPQGAAKALSRCGFVDHTVSPQTLSGGWRKRLAFACALVRNPNLLLLDEPTNHLDLEGILWLELLLRQFQGGVVLVSHDRAFLQGTATRIIELHPIYPGGIFSAEGNYEEFLQKKEEKIVSLRREEQSLANKVRRETAWLRQGAKARTTKAQARIDEAQRLTLALSQAKERGRSLGSVDLAFESEKKGRREILVAEEIALTVGEKNLINNFSLRLRARDIVGLVGANGSGKSSLLRVLSGEKPPSAGSLALPPHLRVRFFEQHRDSLDMSRTLRRTLAPDADFVVYQGQEFHVVSWAQRFLFRSEQLDLPMSALSGGEQARVLLAKFMLQPADLLILDEPTNDLDIDTLEILEESLQSFQGAVLLVSHDRALLDSVCTTIIGLDGEGSVYAVASTDQWLDVQEALKNTEQKKERRPEQEKREAKKQKLSWKEERELEGIEQQIEVAEGQVKELEQLLSNPSPEHTALKLGELGNDLLLLQEKVTLLYHRWEELEGKREKTLP